MIKVEWLVQANLRSEPHDVEQIRSACERIGAGFRDVIVVPFSDDVPDFNPDVIVVPYGGTGWVERIRRKCPNAPGIFFNPESVFTHWNPLYSRHSLNYKARTTTLEALAAEKHGDEEILFVRPVSDQKEFNGGPMRFGDIRQWDRKLQTEGMGFGRTSIVVGEAYQIVQEWRLFILENHFLTGSRYRTHFVLNTDPHVPEKVISFGEAMSHIYSPTPVFVMDVAECGGELYVLEVGCVNSAGFYESDVDAIVCGVCRYLESKA